MPIEKSELLAALKQLAKEGGSDLKAAQDALKIESGKKEADASVFEKLGESAQQAAIEVEKLKVAKLELLDVEAKIAKIEGNREAELKSYNISCFKCVPTKFNVYAFLFIITLSPDL